MAEVSIISASKSYGETVAVEDLSMTIANGEFDVLLGPTGAGKTTTLRLIAGLEKPDIGSISLAGQDVTKLAPANRDVCFVFQQYSLYPHYTVFDNLAFPLRAPGRNIPKGEIEERVREVARLLKIESKLKNRATELSGGEMQRVAIGRALVRSPAVFLMDEPLSSLDAKLRDDLRVELKRIQRDLGATILYVTHDQLEALTLADRIGVLSEGRLVQIGTPREVYEKPSNVYVARRLGSPQINIFPRALFPDIAAPAGATQIGVRPEDVVIEPSAHDGTTRVAAIPAEVLTVEHLGVETVVLLQAGDSQIHALQASHTPVSHGAKTTISVRPNATLFFDDNGESGDGAKSGTGGTSPPTEEQAALA